jgi:phosphate transport system substrate-binding protein
LPGVKKGWLVAPIVVLIYLPVVYGLVAAEGDSRGGSGSPSGPEEEQEPVIVSGSSTVEPISIAVAERFASVGGAAEVNVDGPGTGDGFELFCNGETDINDASRPIEPEEIASCEGNGVEFVELEIAIDGLSVLTSTANEAVDCLSLADLYALVGPEAEGVGDWSDAQDLATELGSSTELPDARLDITGPGEESGTYDSFVELALADIAEERFEAGAITEEQVETTRPDYSSQSDDTAILQGIEGSDSSLGWVGFAYAEGAGDQVKELEIDGGDGCVAPTEETIADGSYPLSRTLYIYVNEARAEENPAVKAYVDYFLRGGISAVEEVGYVALPEDRLTESRRVWSAKETGTRVGGSS